MRIRIEPILNGEGGERNKPLFEGAPPKRSEMRARGVMARRWAPAMPLVLLVLSFLVSRSGCTMSRVPLARLRGGMGKRNLDTADELEEDGMSRATDDVIRARRLFKPKSGSAGEKPRGQGKQFFGMDEKDIPTSA
jgi:hypothetical protein